MFEKFRNTQEIKLPNFPDVGNSQANPTTNLYFVCQNYLLRHRHHQHTLTSTQNVKVQGGPIQVRYYQNHH